VTKRKTDSPQQRLREVIAHKAPAPAESEVANLSDEQLDAYWKKHGRLTLSIYDLPGGPDSITTAKRRLFEHFGMNPNDPLHWHQLVSFFAFVMFWEGSSGKPGRPRKDWSAADAVIADMIAAQPYQSSAKVAERVARVTGMSKRTARRQVSRVKKSERVGH
jgi:hypothetical protein